MRRKINVFLQIVLRSNRRTAPLVALTAIVALGSVASAAIADPDPTAPCRAKFDSAIALEVAEGFRSMVLPDDTPIVYAKSGVLETFAPGVSGNTKPTLRLCDGVSGVTGADTAIVGANSNRAFYVSEPRRVDRLVPPDYTPTAGAPMRTTSIVPPLGADDFIEAIGTNGDGQLEVVVSTGGDAAKPVFYLFAADAEGTATPIRRFTSSAVAAPVSSLAFDSLGELFAYDDDGEIVAFRSDASGIDPTVARTIAGPRSMLRAAINGVRGSRPMTIDRVGHIIAGDDRTIVTFAPDAHGDAVPLEVLDISDFETLHGVGTDSRGFLYLLGISHDPDHGWRQSAVWIFASLADREAGGHAAEPIKTDALAP